MHEVSIARLLLQISRQKTCKVGVEVYCQTYYSTAHFAHMPDKLLTKLGKIDDKMEDMWQLVSALSTPM